jgi:hypothetical protein
MLAGPRKELLCASDCNSTRSMKKCGMPKIAGRSVLLTLTFFLATTVSAQITRPDAEKELARDIYKQFIEIPSGFTTGSTTPVAATKAKPSSISSSNP